MLKYVGNFWSQCERRVLDEPHATEEHLKCRKYWEEILQ